MFQSEQPFGLSETRGTAKIKCSHHIGFGRLCSNHLFPIRDPCHHVQDTTVRESGQENAEKTSVLPREPSSGSLAPSPIKTSGGTEAGSTASHGVKETDRDRSAAHRRREGSATHPIGRGGGQSSAETRHERKRGNRPPDQSLAGFGDPTRCPGEALLWQS